MILAVLGTELVVGEPVRRRAGMAIVASLAVAAAFTAVTIVSKELAVLNVAQPWQDDPYDVPVSFDFVLLPLLIAAGALRAQLCRRCESLPVRRLVDLLRVAGAALAVCLVTEMAEWVAVALGRHQLGWTTWTSWQVVLLVVLTVATIGTWALVIRAARAVSPIARVDSQPDWLADAVTLALRAARRRTQSRGWSSMVIRWTDTQVIARVRAHPIAAAGALATVLALPYVAAKLVLEDYPVPLLLLSFAFVAASLFAVTVVVGAYLRIVAPHRATPPAWLITVLVACTAAAVAFSFHDSLLADQTIVHLSVLYFGAGLAAGSASFMLQTLWRLRTKRPPS